MKKIMILIFSTLMIFSLMACSASQKDVSGTDQNKTKDTAAGNTQAGDDQTEEVFGKVSSIVGNELALDVAKMPEEYLNGPENEDDGAAMDGGSGEVTISGQGSGDGNDSGSNEDSPQIAMIGKNGGVQMINPDDIPKMELEYTGEQRKLTIPAGLPVTDAYGNAMKSSDLKEGNVLKISFTPEGTISSIDVME